MKRKIFNEDHELFRDQFRKFLDKEVVPNIEQWDKDGIVSREVWLRAGENGFLCPWLPEEYGGSGADFIYSVVITEEMSMTDDTGFAIGMHNDIVVPYIWHFGTDEQKKRYLPKCATGDYITAIVMTEPDTGSDLQSVRTTAIKDGDHYIINGQKTFISNGILNNLAVVAVKTDTKIKPAYKGISLFLVEGDNPGYKRGRNLDKMGMHAQDTAELVFEDCRVHKSALLGGEGNGFVVLTKELQQERLIIAIGAVARMHRVLALTKEYIKERMAFGRPIASFQNSRFKMAEMYTIAEMSQVFIDRLIEEHMKGQDVNVETSMAKYSICEGLKTIVDECLQLFGGYGYMEEYPICKAYRDARVLTIFGGSSQIMKEIISKALLK